MPLNDLALAAVRERILVADNDARLFSGPAAGASSVPRVDGDRRRLRCGRERDDIVEALPDGLDTEVAERGREFSGGQQQRLRLARALLADPPILVLVEPTSAVDAHTEARIAARLAAARAGRTTRGLHDQPAACSTGPTRWPTSTGGRVVAEGTHRELLDTSPALRRDRDPWGGPNEHAACRSPTPAQVRRYARAADPAATRGSWRSRWACTRSPPSPAWPRPRLLGDLVEARPARRPAGGRSTGWRSPSPRSSWCRRC